MGNCTLTRRIEGIEEINAEGAKDAFDYWDRDTKMRDRQYRSGFEILFEDRILACQRISFLCDIPDSWVRLASAEFPRSGDESDRHVRMKLVAAALADEFGYSVNRDQVPLSDEPTLLEGEVDNSWIYEGRLFERRNAPYGIADFGFETTDGNVYAEVGTTKAQKITCGEIGQRISVLFVIPYSGVERTDTQARRYECYGFYEPAGDGSRRERRIKEWGLDEKVDELIEEK